MTPQWLHPLFISLGMEETRHLGNREMSFASIALMGDKTIQSFCDSLWPEKIISTKMNSQVCVNCMSEIRDKACTFVTKI